MKEVLVIPGIGDDVQGTQQQLSHWQEFGLQPTVASSKWSEPVASFDKEKERLLKMAKTATAIIGISAGASVALQLAYELNLPLVNICGRIRPGGFMTLYPFFAQRSDRFKASVEQSASLLPSMQIPALTFGSPVSDLLVPYSSIKIDQAKNVVLPPLPHSLAIRYVLKNHVATINSFIEKEME